MIEFKKRENGFEYIEVTNESAQAKIALQGAHIFHFEKDGGKPLLWLSEESDFVQGKAIRGGIPICWPAFGMDNPDLPQHGFARTSLWEFIQSYESDANTTNIVFKLGFSARTLALWDYKFEVTLTITIAETLTLALKTVNLDEKPFRLTEAFHTYFSVDSISTCRIRGLEGKPYLDTLTHEQKRQEGEIYCNSEYDVIFQEVDKPIELVTQKRVVKIQNSGSSSVVVWNPWIEKCKKMSAMKDDAYLRFVCIESANAVDDFRLIQPQKNHTLTTKISF